MAKFPRRALVSSSLSSFLFTYASTTTLVGTRLSAGNFNSPVKTIKKRSNSANYSDDMPVVSAALMQNDGTNSHTTQSSHQNTYNDGYNKYDPYTAQPSLSTAATPAPTNFYNKTIQAQILAAERERIRAEFFATYDVMTGIRIAATLGGFFGLMVFLIVWKSRNSSNETMKVLKDPKMAAVAAVCMQEEEDREIHAAMVATGMSIFPDEYDAIAYRRQRMLSLGNVSAPPMLSRGHRFSSVGGGYSSLLAPPRRFSFSATSDGSFVSGRRKSVSESSRIIENFPMTSSFGRDDFFLESEDELENGDQIQKVTEKHTRTDTTRSKGGFLEVPPPGQDTRRSSSMTCCSTESSYLERRYSAFTLGLSNLPKTLQRKLSTASHTSSPDNWDYSYPDIQVIQATPKPSPCPSERSIDEQIQTNKCKTAKSQRAANAKNNVLPGSVVRKQSIAFYDPEKAQVCKGQQIHSISADIVDVYPYNQTQPTLDQGYHCAGMSTEQQQRRKVALNELNGAEFTRIPITTSSIYENKNYGSYKSTAAMAVANTSGAANSSSISMDSTPLSIDKLNGSGSLGTISAKVLFNGGKRAPLASLSSFKISSLEYPDSEFQSPDEESIFLNNGGDTDEDMQDLSSDSEEVSLGGTHTHKRGKCEGERKPLEKRNSLGQTKGGDSCASSLSITDRRRHSLLRRQQTIGATANTRGSLKKPTAKESSATNTQNPTLPLILTCTGRQASQPRRAQLLQQFSDPQSLPTTTEDDTCSTLNTELFAGIELGTNMGSGTGSTATTLTQQSSLNTVISHGHSSPLSQPNTSHALEMSDCEKSCETGHNSGKIFSTSMSDSIFGSHQPIICMPSSLKDLIVRGSGSYSGSHDRKMPISTSANTVAHVSRSATNLSHTSMAGIQNIGAESNNFETNKLSVMLELPLIKLPTGDNSDSNSNTSDEHEHTKSDEDNDVSRDPSLPSSSRKWSKETLF